MLQLLITSFRVDRFTSYRSFLRLLIEGAGQTAEKLTGNSVSAFAADIDADMRDTTGPITPYDVWLMAFPDRDGREGIAGHVTANFISRSHSFSKPALPASHAEDRNTAAAQ